MFLDSFQSSKEPSASNRSSEVDVFFPDLLETQLGNLSRVDTCKNCARCGKDFKMGTNEAYNIQIKIRLGGISKIFCFCSHANMAAPDKGI